MSEHIADGTESVIDGRRRVYFDGYWVRSYPIPSDTLQEKRRLIEVLARRLFNHIEHGLYIPGVRLDEARRAFEAETDPARKRVKGGMLAASLFNRATDILTKLVELQALGIEIVPSGHLMRACGQHLKEALELGKLVLHRSGQEGIDELWGEPFKVFAYPVEEFFRSRYLKVAMTMRCIDGLAAELTSALAGHAAFSGVAPLIAELARTAKEYSETLRADGEIFDVWASFAVAIERLATFEAQAERPAGAEEARAVDRGFALLKDGRELISSIARARVPMPKSTDTLMLACQSYRAEFDKATETSGAPSSRRESPSQASASPLASSPARPTH
jgi:hypothetical protein